MYESAGSNASDPQARCQTRSRRRCLTPDMFTPPVAHHPSSGTGYTVIGDAQGHPDSLIFLVSFVFLPGGRLHFFIANPFPFSVVVCMVYMMRLICVVRVLESNSRLLVLRGRSSADSLDDSNCFVLLAVPVWLAIMVG